jgi:hypothetical protein
MTRALRVRRSATSSAPPKRAGGLRKQGQARVVSVLRLQGVGMRVVRTGGDEAEAAGRNFVDPLIREICAQTLRVRACAQGHVCCSKAACTLGGVAGELARLSREAHIGCEHQSRVGVWF